MKNLSSEKDREFLKFGAKLKSPTEKTLVNEKYVYI